MENENHKKPGIILQNLCCGNCRGYKCFISNGNILTVN